ncbi:MAG: hypothetical protein GY920_06060 [Aliivibrio sp.]|nr:hypothetical protein [Aliivibrio sp.]
MRVQISPTATQNVKSNSNRLRFLNIEDIEFQMSVLKLGIAYHITMRDRARTNKDFNFHEKKQRLYGSVYVWLQMTDVYKSEQTRQMMERDILKSM